MDRATFKVEIKSPHGKRAIENFEHWLGKVADEAEERWGIVIAHERIDDKPDESAEFKSANEQ